MFPLEEYAVSIITGSGDSWVSRPVGPEIERPLLTPLSSESHFGNFIPGRVATKGCGPI